MKCLKCFRYIKITFSSGSSFSSVVTAGFYVNTHQDCTLALYKTVQLKLTTKISLI